jgi:hypothetical protein
MEPFSRTSRNPLRSSSLTSSLNRIAFYSPFSAQLPHHGTRQLNRLYETSGLHTRFAHHRVQPVEGLSEMNSPGCARFAPTLVPDSWSSNHFNHSALRPAARDMRPATWVSLSAVDCPLSAVDRPLLTVHCPRTLLDLRSADLARRARRYLRIQVNHNSFLAHRFDQG